MVTTPATAAPIKVVIIVGPTGSGTAGNIAEARKLAAQPRGYGAAVTEIYSPNATWSRVSAATQGANILIDMGHGNGWPSPYSPYQENTKDRFGLNSTLNDDNNDLKYYGANDVRKYIHLAPNAVVILHGMCYTAGNSEPGNPIPSIEGGRERIENFTAGFLQVGAKVVFAEPGGDVSYILTALFTSKTTARKIFMSESVTTAPLIAYPSHRTAGAHLIAQRDRTGHFRRSVTGSLSSRSSATGQLYCLAAGAIIGRRAGANESGDRMTLREIQHPIKAHYQDEPDAARITLRATGAMADGVMSCSVDVGRALYAAEAHPGVGGAGGAACSGDLVLGALAACAQLTCQMVAANMGLADVGVTVTVEGDLDLRGTLGSADVPVGFEAIRVRFALDGSVPEDRLVRLKERTERYCVVLQTLLVPPRIEATWDPPG